MSFRHLLLSLCLVTLASSPALAQNKGGQRRVKPGAGGGTERRAKPVRRQSGAALAAAVPGSTGRATAGNPNPLVRTPRRALKGMPPSRISLTNGGMTARGRPVAGRPARGASPRRAVSDPSGAPPASRAPQAMGAPLARTQKSRGRWLKRGLIVGALGVAAYFGITWAAPLVGELISNAGEALNNIDLPGGGEGGDSPDLPGEGLPELPDGTDLPGELPDMPGDGLGGGGDLGGGDGNGEPVGGGPPGGDGTIAPSEGGAPSGGAAAGPSGSEGAPRP